MAVIMSYDNVSIVHIKYAVDVILLIYVYCKVWYRVIAASYVRSAVISFYTITLLMIIWNDHWTTMNYLYSLKVFLTHICQAQPKGSWWPSSREYVYLSTVLFRYCPQCWEDNVWQRGWVKQTHHVGLCLLSYSLKNKQNGVFAVALAKK